MYVFKLLYKEFFMIKWTGFDLKITVYNILILLEFWLNIKSNLTSIKNLPFNANHIDP